MKLFFENKKRMNEDLDYNKVRRAVIDAMNDLLPPFNVKTIDDWDKDTDEVYTGYVIQLDTEDNYFINDFMKRLEAKLLVHPYLNSDNEIEIWED